MDKWTNGQMDKWTNGQMDKWTNGQMDKWTNGQMGSDSISDNPISETLRPAFDFNGAAVEAGDEQGYTAGSP